MAIQLKKAGVQQVTIFEKAADVGGCWRDNTYPGAACDVPSHLYSFSFEPKHDWSRKYAQQAEIHAYLKHCARKYGVLEQIRFNTEVASASFDEARALWRVSLASGEVHEAQVLVSACGQLNRPLIPNLKGLSNFVGEQFHSARWDHSVPLAGRRVAVIGTGASAIQFVPEIAPQVAQLSVFQRSAPYVIAKSDRPYGKLEHALLSHLPLLQSLSRCLQYWSHEARALGFTKFASLMAIPKFSFLRRLQKQVSDPVLRQQLTPDYPVGCKRILISNDYYGALTRSNVAVIGEEISEVTATGVITSDGKQHAADVLIYGTGFKALDFLAPMQIAGRDGRDLNQAWRDGAEAYLGITVSGFPNLFMLYGPNTNLGHNSIVFMLESQIGYVIQAVQALARGVRVLEVKADVQQVFNARLQQLIKRSVWDADCTSWYKTASGKNTNNWPGFTFEYRQATRQLKLGDFQTV